MIAIAFKQASVLLLLLLALISDIKTCKIKNFITYGFMIAGLAINYKEKGIEGFVLSLQGIILPVVCLLILYIIKVIGAGDIKLFSAVGAVAGGGFVLYAIVFSFICGGFIASGIILARKNGLKRFKNLLLYVKSCLISMRLLQYEDPETAEETGRFRFSIAIASGTAAVLMVFGLGPPGVYTYL